jgi:hypothetical protein
MWPSGIAGLQTTSAILLYLGATAAGISAAAALASTLMANRAADLMRVEADQKIVEANERADIARREAEDAHAAAEQSRLQAAKVEQQNIEMRQKFANRQITKEQHDILVRELQASPASFNIETMGDSESGLYAADILRTLTDAKWKVDQKVFPLGVVWTGLQVFMTDDPAATRLVQALQKANIPVGIGNEHRDKVTIMVGGRPPVF